ncbi:MAG: fumarylacetoacetate hydrolase family protein [bacterium]|nr:fumarylacetoacetate hydrolase family protein [bacterium]
MRLLRFLPPLGYDSIGNHAPDGEPLWGLVEGEWVVCLDSPPFDGLPVPGKARYPLREVRIAAPVQPGKIVAVGMNYEGHIREMGHDIPSEPLIFLKAPSAVIAPEDRIVLPPESNRVDFEGELAVVIGRRCRRVHRDAADQYILGYTIINDVTARDLQRKDVQFSRGKSFDTFCPMGPWIETELDPGDVRITTVVNSEVRQDDQTSTMLFNPAILVEFITSVMTLMPGDVIATGTPEGVGALSEGDEVSVAVDGIGVLTNTVIKESM